jgi:hypothetical protein
VHRDRPAFDDSPPTAHEADIIETAVSTAANLPEAYAAARMFFRFDPCFRAELEGARLHWCGSTEPLRVADLPEERQFDFDAAIRNSARLREAAHRLAARWGFAVQTVVEAIAYDEPLQYPVVQILPRQEEPITGTRHVEIRVYSSHVWTIVRRALDGIEWLPGLTGLSKGTGISWFEDKPEGSRKRARGMDGDIAARTLALHFLVEAPRGARPSGGQRTWDEAVALWRDVTGLEPGEPQPWSRARSRLLRGIFRRLMEPRRTLADMRDARGLDDAGWSEELGIHAEVWNLIQLEQAVPGAVWERIKQAVPEIADDVDAYLDVGFLKIAT